MRFPALRFVLLALLVLGGVDLSVPQTQRAKVTPTQAAEVIRRLDGTTMSADAANAFAGKTLEAAHVTGAEIAVINHGRLVWSAAFGLRRKEPALPMDRETTTWAASITKGVFATYLMHLVE